ncbi:unnamed protein product, partial [Brassica rapa subsp. narinosa]
RREKLISFAKRRLLRSSTRMAGRSLLASGATEVGQMWHFSSLQQMRFSQRYRCYPGMQFTFSHTRYRVELSVDDGNDNAMFVVFDMEKTKLAKRDAADLGGNYRHVLKSLLERNNTCHFIHFHIKPSYLFHQSSSNNQAPVVEGEGGETAASASNTAAAGDDEPNPPGFEAIENSRKRTCE